MKEQGDDEKPFAPQIDDPGERKMKVMTYASERETQQGE
jgi:hypothetical protein